MPQNEVIVGAAVQERVASPVARRHVDSDALRTRQREVADASDSPLRTVAEGPINKDNLDALVDANTRTYNGDGTERIDAARRTSAKDVAERLVKIQKGEVGDLTAMAIDSIVQQAVELVIVQTPELQALYGSMTSAQKIEYRLSLLRDPNTKTQISQLLQERAANGKLIQTDIEGLRQETDRLQTERTGLEAEKATKSTTLTSVETELDEHQTRAVIDASTTPPTVTIIDGKFVKELKSLQGKVEPLRQDCEILKNQIDKLQEELDAAHRGKTAVLARPSSAGATAVATLSADQTRAGDLGTHVGELEVKINEKQTKLAEAQKKLAEGDQRMQDIRAREAVLKEQKQQLKDRLGEINTKLTGIGPELAQKITELHGKETQWDLDSRSFVGGLETILSESISDTINKDYDRLSTTQATIEQDCIQNAKSEQERQIRMGIDRMYKNVATGRTDYNQFRAGWAGYLLNGADVILAANLPVGMTMDQLRGNADLYNQLVSDVNTKMARLRVGQPRRGAIRGRLPGPEPMTRMEMNDLVDRFGEPFLDSLVAADATLKTKMEALAEGEMVRGRIGEKLKKMPLGKAGMILAILMSFGLFSFAKNQ